MGVENKKQAKESADCGSSKMSPRRGLRNAAPTSGKRTFIDLTAEDEDFETSVSKKRKPVTPRKSKEEEKRLKVFRKQAPQSYLEKLSRALGQR